MTQIVIDKKKYVLIPEKDYTLLQKKVKLSPATEKILTIDEARAFSKKLINKWNKEK